MSVPTVKSSELSKAIKEMKAELIKQTGEERINQDIWFVNNSSECVQIHIMLNEFRMMKSDEACQFAECITKAANLAKNFKYNGYQIAYN